ncbi:MAG: GNAT family N-acetyltransferase [candidate division Zixibacteria bacterium]|nr:GNAT family N-acetyltransferase [candidate division Zixibacteria bacterium]
MDPLDHKIKNGIDFTDRDLLTRFTPALMVTPDLTDRVVANLSDTLSEYKFDHYLKYPALHKSDWIDYLVIRFKQLLDDDEWFFLYNPDDNVPHLVGCRISKWDYELFGVRMASIAVFSCGDSVRSGKILSDILDGCLALLRDQKVEFVSCRTGGDNIPAIHAFESCGFHYYENNIWPVIDCHDVADTRSSRVRLMTDSDFEQVIDIAKTSSFQQSHYHCDEKLDNSRADLVLAKYVESARSRNEPIAVIESNGTVAGFFAFKIDEQLSGALGYKYGRMKNLAMSKSCREKGLGSELFTGTTSLMKEMGAEQIDSGYSSKNHVSAKLHTQHGMHSVYEEATFHLWL